MLNGTDLWPAMPRFSARCPAQSDATGLWSYRLRRPPNIRKNTVKMANRSTMRMM